VLQWLEKHGSKKTREEMLTRYGITAPKAWGVKVGMLHKLAKQVGRDHGLALKLWNTGWYEARTAWPAGWRAPRRRAPGHTPARRRPSPSRPSR
jgi:hypothetical protein